MDWDLEEQSGQDRTILSQTRRPNLISYASVVQEEG